MYPIFSKLAPHVNLTLSFTPAYDFIPVLLTPTVNSVNARLSSHADFLESYSVP